VKKTLTALALIALIAVGVLGGWVLCRWDTLRSSPPDTCPEAEVLRWVEKADVIADFRQHVERDHDMRFLSVFGLSFATEFPGLEDTPDLQRLVQQHGSRRIEGTTDALSCMEQHRLLDQVFHYAARYNSMLLGYLEPKT
jgi:hypothetical protein